MYVWFFDNLSTISFSLAENCGKLCSNFSEEKSKAPWCFIQRRVRFTSPLGVIYIGSAWTNEGVFPLLNAKTKTEGAASYLQFGASIKMQIARNHFSAVTMEALSLQRPKTARRMDPPNSTAPEFFIFELKTWTEYRGIHFFLSGPVFPFDNLLLYSLLWC